MNSEGGSDFLNHHIMLLQKIWDIQWNKSVWLTHRTKTKQSIETIPEKIQTLDRVNKN